MHSQTVDSSSGWRAVVSDLQVPTPQHVATVFRPRISAEELLAAAKDGRWLEASVRKNWGDYNDEIREALRALAHEVAIGDDGPRALFHTWSDRLCLAWMVFRRQLGPVVEFMNAVESLIEAIEEATERDNPDYQSDIVEALESCDPGDESGMTIDEFEQWSERAANRTLQEL